MNLVRLRRMLISPDVLFHVFQTGSSWRVDAGIPEEARVRGFTLDPQTQCLNLFIECEEFEEIDVDSEIAPTLQTLFKKI